MTIAINVKQIAKVKKWEPIKSKREGKSGLEARMPVADPRPLLYKPPTRCFSSSAPHCCIQSLTKTNSSSCCDNILGKADLGRKGYFGSQFKGTDHDDREGVVTGT